MISDIDIRRAAWSMIRRYGDDAEAQAAMRGDELLDRGDLDGAPLARNHQCDSDARSRDTD
jgi:hypothetical protein